MTHDSNQPPTQAPVLAAAMQHMRAACGMSLAAATADGSEWPYLDGGQPDATAVLCVHGFGADKDNWPQFAKHLLPEYRVIAPDLPGYGDHQIPDDWALTMPRQLARLEAFVDALGVDRLHIVGNSMGGYLATRFALRNPQRVESLAVLCPAGVREPQPSALSKGLARGQNLLIPESEADYLSLTKLLFAKPTSMSSPLAKAFMQHAIARASFRKRAFADFAKSVDNLAPDIGKLGCRTLVVWGEHDGVIDPSCAEVWREHVPHAQVQIMQDVAHMPMLEQPARMAKRYLEFFAGTRD